MIQDKIHKQDQRVNFIVVKYIMSLVAHDILCNK